MGTPIEPESSELARTEILRRIRVALRDGLPEVTVPRDYQRSLPPGVDIHELFAERVADYRATVHRTPPAQLPATIAAALSARGARRIAVPAGVPDVWLAESEVQSVRDDPPLSVHELDELDGVITGCAIATAETGTIILNAGPAQGRRALSLLPDYHLCVVDEAQIVGTVPEAIARLDPICPLTWISGPSATSDIELQRVEGVHGPRTLDVVIVESRAC